MKVNQQQLGNIDDQPVFSYELTNDNNVKVCISDLGATIIAIMVPDKNGSVKNIVLGYDSLDEYLDDPFYVGGTIGRFAGRISKSAFSIDGKVYKLQPNDGKSGNHLHGGVCGFNKRMFKMKNLYGNNSQAVVQLYYKSIDLEEGYPGNLNVWITFKLTPQNELKIYYKAETDQPTHVNLTNHSYFNLSGTTGDALLQTLFINADNFLITDGNYIPTGEIKEVSHMVNDFRSSPKIATCNFQDLGNGYNGYFILNSNKSRGERRPDAILVDTATQRKMEVITSLPGLVFYAGEYLSGKFNKCAGICLETQFFPDAPNQPGFKGTLLLPGEIYNQYTSFKFSW